VVGFAVSMVVLQLWHAELALDTRIAVAAAAGICGALAELFSSSAVDDNFSIPTTAGAGAWLALHLMA
jgi:dolichol kinase